MKAVGDTINGFKLISREGPRKDSCLFECPICGGVFFNSIKGIRKRTTSGCKYCNQHPLEKDISGKTFGKLLVLRKVVSTNNKTKYLTICDCGEYRIAGRAELVNGKITHCKSLHHRRGPEHWRYSEDSIREDRNSLPGYKEWRQAVYKRDGYKCRICGNKGIINAHHIYGYRNNEELRITQSNGITLCAECHKEYHLVYGKTATTFDDFSEFLYNKGNPSIIWELEEGELLTCQLKSSYCLNTKVNKLSLLTVTC